MSTSAEQKRIEEEAEAFRKEMETLLSEADAADKKAAAARSRVQAVLHLLAKEQEAAASADAAARAARERITPPSDLKNEEPLHGTSDGPAPDIDLVTANLHAQATNIQNIRSLVPIVLELHSSNYSRWRENILLVLQRYALTDLVLTDAVFPRDSPWGRMDGVVTHWIYGTISTDLQDVIRKRGVLLTARQAWLAVEGQFLGNRESRALQIDALFRNFVQGDLGIDAYCRKMKGFADSLNDLGYDVPDRQLVLNVLRGLNAQYDHLRAILTHTEPFPSFQKVHNDLCMEEIQIGTRGTAPSSTPTAFYTPSSSTAATGSQAQGGQARPPTPGSQSNSEGGKKNKYKGKNTGKGGTPSWPSFYNPWTGTIQMWPGSQQQQRPSQQPQRPPQQAMMVAAPPGFQPRPLTPPLAPIPGHPGPFQPSLPVFPGPFNQQQPPHTAPTAPAPLVWGPWSWDQQSLANSFSTATLNSPASVTDWVVDSGASNHTTPDNGNITSFRPLNSAVPSSVIVGNGSVLPVTSVGDSVLPGTFYLNNILLTPDIIQNLLSVRQFTTDNSVSMEFDPLGLSVKDLATRDMILRSNSSGPCYTLRLPRSSCVVPTFAAVTSASTWHHRLGHPGQDTLSRLSSISAITCNKHRPSCSSPVWALFFSF